MKWGDNKVAIREKDYGLWNVVIWKGYYEHVKYFALGLKSLGFERGEHVSIVGNNEPEWVYAELAAQSLGGVVIGVYQDSTPSEVKYIVEKSDSVYVIAEDQEQADKLLEIRDEIPVLRKVVYWDAKGMRNYDDPILISFREVQALGRAYEKSHPEFFEAEIDKGTPDDTALILTTSGTVSLPKLAMLSHRNMLKMAENLLAKIDPMQATDEFVSCLPLAWVGEQMIAISGAMRLGFTVNFPEEPTTVQENIREIAPHIMFSPPRIWEGIPPKQSVGSAPYATTQAYLTVHKRRFEMRFFNTAGPVRCEEHYYSPPLTRLDLDELLSLIEQRKYFVLHAPRQTGKTTCLLALMDELNRAGDYRCLYCNVEMGQAAREDVLRGIQAILGEISGRARDFLKDTFLQERLRDLLDQYGPEGALNGALTLWSEASPKPIVLLIDEIDSLVGDTLISVLRQLRAGYDKRPALFPQSIILCGVRDVRDYRIHSSQEKAIITGGSAFNVKAESLRLGDFSREEVETLLMQHTEETGQVFEAGAISLVWELTHGQPWLVNAVAYEVCFRMKANRDRSKTITAEMVAEAKEELILRRETHLDQLVDKLAEERVRRVIAPMLAGTGDPNLIPTDEVQYVRDLGLIRTDEGQLSIANQIYREVIPRELTYSTQLTITHQPAWYIQTDGRLDLAKLLSAFQQFFREHSESWIQRFDYKEAGPQLLMQAFLQRIVNSGGRVEREYGLGQMRTDLLVIWGHPGGVQKSVIELKLRYGTLKRTVEDGLAQTRTYMDRCDTEEGHLVIFDRDAAKSWEERIFRREESYRGTAIKVWGM